MNSKISKLFFSGVLTLAAALAPAHAAAQSTRNFTIFNDSRYRINQLYVAPESNSTWGINRLEHALPTNYRADLAVDPGWYDVMLVDQDGDKCVVSNVDFRNGDSWTITDQVLVTCELLSLR
jgi:hypothetical protein